MAIVASNFEIVASIFEIVASIGAVRKKKVVLTQNAEPRPMAGKRIYVVLIERI